MGNDRIAQKEIPNTYKKRKEPTMGYTRGPSNTENETTPMGGGEDSLMFFGPGKGTSAKDRAFRGKRKPFLKT